jgi:hypothetical protein
MKNPIYFSIQKNTKSYSVTVTDLDATIDATETKTKKGALKWATDNYPNAKDLDAINDNEWNSAEGRRFRAKQQYKQRG